MSESNEGDRLRASLLVSSYRRGLDRDLGVSDSLIGEEQVSLFYGGSRKVICGLGFRGRLTCSSPVRNTEQQQTPQKPNNVSTTGL